jgi:hypothetical protein
MVTEGKASVLCGQGQSSFFGVRFLVLFQRSSNQIIQSKIVVMFGTFENVMGHMAKNCNAQKKAYKQVTLQNIAHCQTSTTRTII